MTRTNIILLNGLPRTGKDTMATILHVAHDFTHLKLATPLHAIAANMAQMSFSEWNAMYESDQKDKPNKKLNMNTPREFIIWLAEEVIKPKFGVNYFAKIIADRIKSMEVDASGVKQATVNVVISDVGFPVEVTHILNEFDPKHVHLVRAIRKDTPPIHDSRSILCPNSSFNSDSFDFDPMNFHIIDTSDGLGNGIEILTEKVLA